MAKRTLDHGLLEAAVVGGSFYGGGGGGSPLTGREMGNLALSLGDPQIIGIGEVPPDAVLVTVSAVGAPAACGRHAKAFHYIRAVELLAKHTRTTPYGFISNECGGLATVNGWIQAAAFGLPVVDAPCNGRAHPTGAMGSMGLHSAPGYISVQAAVGGSQTGGTYLEVLVTGGIEQVSNLVRKAAVQAGGLVAVARNPVDAAYVREHGAPGAVQRCFDVGKAILDAAGDPAGMIEAAVACAGGRILCSGEVLRKDLRTSGGFDVGGLIVEGGYGLTFWNEYMTVEKSGDRLATFPDLIVTMDEATGLPVSTAEVRSGQRVAVAVVPRDALILGAGVRDRGLYHTIEEAIGKSVVDYVF